MSTVLIDGDILAYRCGFAAEHTLYKAEITEPSGEIQKVVFSGKSEMNKYLKDHPEVTEYSWESELQVEPIDFVLSTVKHMIANIKEASGCDKSVIYLSSKHNFRDAFATVMKYKGNRDKTRRPMHHAGVIDYLFTYHHAVAVHGLEADDLLADAMVPDGSTVLASIDKDLLQVPGRHFNFVTGNFQTVTAEEGLRSLHRQMLTGDSTDNIPGIMGIGPVKAEKILADVSETDRLYDVVRGAWKEHFSGPKPPEWLTNYDNEVLSYQHWNGSRVVTKHLDEFLEELSFLLRVGIPEGMKA